MASGKHLDYIVFKKRLTELDLKLQQGVDHLKKSYLVDDQYQTLRSINSALNRRAALVKIEKEFETTPMARTDGFNWSTQVKP